MVNCEHVKYGFFGELEVFGRRKLKKAERKLMEGLVYTGSRRLNQRYSYEQKSRSGMIGVHPMKPEEFMKRLRSIAGVEQVDWKEDDKDDSEEKSVNSTTTETSPLVPR